jgi:acetylornithine/N-succinyldiaminopimelate aminotransferase
MEHILWYDAHKLILKDIVKGENCYLYNSQGHRYVDLESGMWSASLGHSHPRIVQAIKEQAEKISHTGYCYSNPIVEAAAKEVLDTIGFPHGKCVFLNSGSEAVEFAVKVAKTISKKPMMFALSDSYFGAYGSAGEKREDEWCCFEWKGCSTCSDIHECVHTCAPLSEIPFKKIGGFAFEPGSSSGLVRFPPKKLIQTLANEIQHSDGFLIANEVTTGIGRTGEWYGFQHYGLQPDIIAAGKALGNGYPVSAVAMSQKVVERLANSSFHYAQSHQNDPLGAAVAREVIRVIHEEHLIERGKKIGARFIRELIQLANRHDRIKEVRGRGLMIAIEFRETKNDSLASYVYDELLKRRFIVGKRPKVNVLRIDPSLTVQENDIHDFLINFEQILTN